MKAEERLRIGHEHEQRVRFELERRGWTVQHFGQGLFAEEIRRALQFQPFKVMWRWLPDLIAARDGRALLVDPKSDIRTDTPNFSIEQAAICTHNFMLGMGLPIVYVFSDLSCNYVHEIDVERVLLACTEGPLATAGSGTPFALVRKDKQISLDEVFGVPLPIVDGWDDW